VLNNLGVEAYYEGRWDDAIELYEQSRELRRRTGDVARVAVAMSNVGEIRSDQGRLEEAETLLREAMEIADSVGDELTSCWARATLGRAAARAGKFDESAELLERALEQFRELSAMAYATDTEARLAELEALRGRAEAAILRAQAPLTTARASGGSAPLEALLHRVIGMAHVQLGEPAAARDAFETSLGIARTADAPYEVALTLQERALLNESEEDAAEAREIFDRLGVVGAA
jgi:tetratricopeptide (TPR) repeat protein